MRLCRAVENLGGGEFRFMPLPQVEWALIEQAADTVEHIGPLEGQGDYVELVRIKYDAMKMFYFVTGDV